MMDKIIQDLERCEMEAVRSFYESASPASHLETSVQLHTVEQAVVAIVPTVDILALNRVIGLGLDGRLNPSTLESITEIFRAARAPRFILQLSPLAKPEDHIGLLAAEGFAYHSHWVRLYRQTDVPVPDVESHSMVREVGPAESELFGKLVSEAFGWTSGVGTLVAQTVGRPGWRHFMAWEGGALIATGAIFISGPTAWLNFASTLPDYRGRGAQSALLAHRIREAQKLGCKAVTVEAVVEKGASDPDSASYRNLLKLGFHVTYDRPNFIHVF